MFLDRRGDIAIAESFVPCHELTQYLTSVIDIYSSVEIDEQYWVTKREKEFLVATSINVLKGYTNPISPESLQIYKKYFNPTIKNNNISNYIDKLRKKKWLQYDAEKKEIKLTPILNSISIEKDRIDFRIRLDFDDGGQIN
jgi:hypothetical protein